MKKIYISLMSVFIICVLVLAGCSKAENATLKECHLMYAQMATNYGTTEKYVFSSDGKTLDLYSADAYAGSAIYQAIVDQKTNFDLLALDAQYQVVLEVANSFYKNYSNYLIQQDFVDYEAIVSKQQKAKLYTAIESMRFACDDVVATKKSLVTICGQTFDETKDVVKRTLKRYLVSYQNLIEKTVEVSSALENIYVQNMIADVPQTISSGEGKRLVESAKLYIANYLSIAYFDKEENAFENISNNQVLQKLVQLKNGIYKDFSAEPTEQELQMYQQLVEKLNRFKTEVNNYKTAKIIYNTLNKNAENFEQSPYVRFVESFEQQVLDFSNCFVVNMLA